MAATLVETPRLWLRQVRAADQPHFAAINADPAVMEWFPRPLSTLESDQFVERILGHWRTEGFGLWALEVKRTGAFIGFTGLSRPAFQAHFTPAVEVSWRLARSAWGCGYASEAGRASLAVGFGELGLEEIVSFTSRLNRRSEAVMRRLGMVHHPADDFQHPNLPPDHLLSNHVLYRISREHWLALEAGAGAREPGTDHTIPPD